MEKTLVVVKPDGVQRNLTGEIIKRYQEAGLKLVALKMLKVKQSLIKKHYPEEEAYVVSLGKKSEKAGEKIDDYYKQGMMIIRGLRKYLTEGPVVAMILEGEGAIQKVREVTGYTDPVSAAKGTIRGDFGQDNILQANKEKRSVKNLIHASGNPEEAQKEIALWFKPKEIVK